MLSDIEGISYKENPLDFFIMLARYKFVARLLDKGMSVLEVGCGHGIGSLFLSKFCNLLCATDIDAELVKYCETAYSTKDNSKIFYFKKLDILKNIDLKEWPVQFDAVVLLDVIEHFTKADAEIAVKNAEHFLKDGGFAIIGTPNKNSAEFASDRRKKTHLFEYDIANFKDLLKKSFRRAFVFSMTDENISTGFSEMAWYFMALCLK